MFGLFRRACWVKAGMGRSRKVSQEMSHEGHGVGLEAGWWGGDLR